MLSELIDPSAQSPRSKLFWSVIAVVALVQLAALYMLCNQQVRNGKDRETALQVQRMAINECLESVPHSTIGSCARQALARNNDRPAVQDGIVSVSSNGSALDAARVMTTAMPVSFAIR